MAFKILVIDDNEDDRFFLKRAISNSGVIAVVSESGDGTSGLKKIQQQSFDCVFLDYQLPGMNGMDILKAIRALGIDTPIIMLTGQKNEQTIVQLMQEGATDYLSKDMLHPESVRLSIENSRKMYLIKKEKATAEQALRQSEAKLAEAQRIARIGNWEYDFSTKTTFFSEEVYRILEYPHTQNPSLIGFRKKIHPDDFIIMKRCVENLKATTQYDINFRIYTSDNHLKYLNAKGHLTHDQEGNIRKIIGTIQDITVLKNALYETKKATTQRKATSIVLGIAIFIFLVSEAVLDPFIDSLATGLFITLSFKGSIALMLKPLEIFLSKMMMSRI